MRNKDLQIYKIHISQAIQVGLYIAAFQPLGGEPGEVTQINETRWSQPETAGQVILATGRLAGIRLTDSAAENIVTAAAGSAAAVNSVPAQIIISTALG